MCRRTIFVVVINLVLFSMTTVLADVPGTVTIQGRLTDSTGTPVADGPTLINFKIYASPGGGDQLWVSGFQLVPVTGGLFNYELGSATPLPDSLFTSGSERHLGITVGVDPEMTPRVRLTSGPFAFQAAEADSSDYAATIADNAVTTTKIADGTILLVDIAQNGAGPDQIIKWDGGGWVVANDESGGGGWNWSDSSSHGPDSVLFADSALFAESSLSATSAESALTAGRADSATYADTADYARLADFADSTDAITDGAVDLDDIGQNGAGPGQVIKWNVGGWVVGDDESGGGGWNWSDSSSHGPDSVLFADSARFAAFALSATSADYSDSTDAITDGGVDFVDIGQNGAKKGQVMKWAEKEWVAADDEVGGGGGAWTDDGTVVRLDTSADSVGIGTAAPSAKLEVVGDVVITGKTTIGPGHTNTGMSAFVAGSNNKARGHYSVVSGGGGPADGDSNSALGGYSTIGGGRINVASGTGATVGGGTLNSATNDHATVGGGFQNFAYYQSTVAGGSRNVASGFISTVGGGEYNKARGNFSVIAGGGGSSAADSSVATGDYSAVGGGRANTAEGDGATVGGGGYNLARGAYASVGGGVHNYARGHYSTIGGGGGGSDLDSNSASGRYSTIGGGYRNVAGAEDATVGGGARNYATGFSATIGGGSLNTADSARSVVSGGYNNHATSLAATVSGGVSDTASGRYSTVTGGYRNTASDIYATVCGGENNEATGWHSTVVGGGFSKATGSSSFAAGVGAEALHDHSVVIGESDRWYFPGTSPYPIQSSCNGQMVLYASEEFYLTRSEGGAAPCGTWFLGTSTGATLTTGGAWTNSSDVHKKENFTPLDRRTLLEKVATLPIEQWNYRDEDATVRHIGPMAQDFNALFGVGSDSTSISTIDPAGIALAAIQELHKTTQELNTKAARIDALESELAELRRLVQGILNDRQ